MWILFRYVYGLLGFQLIMINFQLILIFFDFIGLILYNLKTNFPLPYSLFAFSNSLRMIVLLIVLWLIFLRLKISFKYMLQIRHINIIQILINKIALINKRRSFLFDILYLIQKRMCFPTSYPCVYGRLLL
jgi:hypothetical protein